MGNSLYKTAPSEILVIVNSDIKNIRPRRNARTTKQYCVFSPVVSPELVK
jgi:hypothetical protein